MRHGLRYHETEATHYVGTETLAAVSARERSLADATLRHRTRETSAASWLATPMWFASSAKCCRAIFRRFDEAIAERHSYIASGQLESQRQLREEAAARPWSRFARWFRRCRTRPLLPISRFVVLCCPPGRCPVLGSGIMRWMPDGRTPGTAASAKTSMRSWADNTPIEGWR
jgi:hypothetical protein